MNDREAPQRFWHYVKPNETTRLPRRYIFLDTEAHQDDVPGGRTQRWAVAVACFRIARPDRPARETWSTYDDPELMWKEVDVYCGASGRTILWTHNLGYDSRISDMFDVLPAQGWSLVAHNLSSRGTWLVWRRGRATLCMVDSASVFPTTLAQVGKTLRMGKLPLPPDNVGGVGLYSRCWRDVEILRTAMVEYLAWLEREDLGNWQMTGSGQAWAAYRHRFMDRRLLVHDDETALSAERRAMWTGRCEAFWHGELNYQVVHEWDLTTAYPRIAEQCPVPVRLLGPMPDGYDWRACLSSTSTALLAEVTVTTEVPVVPTEHQGRILWPVGTFATILWDPEILAALDAGAQVTVHRAWLYHKAPALQRWARWILDQLQSIEDGDGDFRWIVLRHWMRALIGRMAMTHMSWEEYATAPRNGVRAHQVYDRDTGETFGVVQVGRTMWRETGVVEWAHSMPMVTGYVQSVARVRLWTILQEIPPDAALYADTDSVLVTDRHEPAMAAVAALHPTWGLRLKRSWQGFAVWGPRQIRTGALARVSGVAKGAQRTDRKTFQGEVWETLAGALARGHANQVVIRDRTWHIKGVDHRRDGPEIGWTQPIRLGGVGNHATRDRPGDDGPQRGPDRGDRGPGAGARPGARPGRRVPGARATAGSGTPARVPGPARPARPGRPGGGREVQAGAGVRTGQPS